jgi:hypothetical protein
MPALARAEADSLGDVVLALEDAALGRFQLARDEVEPGRLAGAVRADDDGQLARHEGAGDVVDRRVPAEADGQVLGADGGGFMSALPESDPP